MISVENLNENPYGLLTARSGPWVGRPIKMFLYVCNNAACRCTDMTIALVDPEISESKPLAKFSVDIHLKQLKENGQEEVHSDIIDKLVKEFNDEDWKTLWSVFSGLKLKMTEDIDFENTHAQFPASNIEREGELIPYDAILPFAEKFFLGDELDGILIDEQYCLIRNCRCKRVTICFLQIQNGVQVPDAPSAVRIDYKTGVIDEVDSGSGTREAALEIWGQARKKYPNLLELFSRRHKQLNKLYENYRTANPPQATIASAAKIGRNDPCPCNSGKKYKKCCLETLA